MKSLIVLLFTGCASWDIPDKQDPRYCPNKTTNCHINASKPDTLSFMGEKGQVANIPLKPQRNLYKKKNTKKSIYKIPKELIIGVDLDLTSIQK